MTANLELALELVRKVEIIAPHYGAHVALTGGCLYKEGDRKDIDIMFYRIRQVERIDIAPMFEALGVLVKLQRIKGGGWVHKAKYKGVDVDCFFPEEQRDEFDDFGY